MSDTDSFIDEVNEEVRRDRFFGYLRRYGWIGATALVVIIGGAGFIEYRKAQAEAQAQALGDAMLDALALEDADAQAAALRDLETAGPESAAMRAFMLANAEVEAGNTDAAVAALQGVENSADLPLAYRQFAAFRRLLVQGDSIDLAIRRAGFAELAVPGVDYRLLAEEQLALIDIEAGDTDAAIARFRSITNDAEATAGLQQRAVQAIVALGGTLDETGGSDGDSE
ncbi:MAG: tetratricopeptide repeat protein [Pseudomonadota bacterium]